MPAGVTYTSAQLQQAQAIADALIQAGILPPTIGASGGVKVEVIAGGGEGSGIGGDASSANQITEIARLEALLARLPDNLANNRLLVDNSQVTQPISGTVNVGNLPAIQAVSGNVAITNLPTTQAVSGNVAITNYPTVQTITGRVAVSNFPTTQTITATSLPLPNGAATDSNLQTLIAQIGAINELAAASDTDSKGLNGLLKRLLQRFSILLNSLPTKLSNSNRFLVESLNIVTTYTDYNSLIGGASSIAIAGNQSRKHLIACNNSNADIYLSLSSLAVLGRGILLRANGGTYEINAANLYLGPVSAIAPTTASLSATEGI